jgi:NADPH:quinone reductase-like Zn-dependent oxidoreductase
METTGQDVWVRVHAASVKPVGLERRDLSLATGEPRVLGWDARGVVETGATASRNCGPDVYNVGDATRPGLLQRGASG